MLHFHQRQWPKVIGLALFHGRAQTLQWPQRRTHGKPHQQQRADSQHPQAQQSIGHQAASHGDPRLIGFGHTYLRHAIHVRFGDGLEQADHSHVLALILGVIKARQRRIVIGARRARRRARQVLVAGNQLLVNIVDLVVNPSGAVVGERIQGHVRHVGTQGPVAMGQAGRNGPRRGQQRAVVSRVGRLAPIPVSAQAAGEHQHHQQQRQVPQQAPAQAAGLMHRELPASTPGHGR